MVRIGALVLVASLLIDGAAADLKNGSMKKRSKASSLDEIVDFLEEQPDEAPVVVGFYDQKDVKRNSAAYDQFVNAGGVKSNTHTAFLLVTNIEVMVALGVPSPLPRVVSFWFNDDKTEYYMRMAGFFAQGDGMMYTNGELPVLATLHPGVGSSHAYVTVPVEGEEDKPRFQASGPQKKPALEAPTVVTKVQKVKDDEIRPNVLEAGLKDMQDDAAKEEKREEARRRLEERKAERATDGATEDAAEAEAEAVLIDIQDDGEPVDVQEEAAVV